MRLVIVSNRLPVSLSHRNGEFHAEKSAGGLVSGLSDYLASLKGSSSPVTEYLWIGWPGISVRKDHEKSIRDKVSKSFNASPVFLSEKLMDKVYLGFCNRTIWPLFHYFPSYAVFDGEYWEQYRRVNEIFRDELLKIIKPGDVIWVHDYHLMLLPEMLREEISNPIGFFLHIPFPSYEIFRLLPDRSRNGILKGLLGADLIGFHTHDYSQYFLSCVLRILGIENHMGKIDLPGRMVSIDTFPMGIDYDKFNKFVLDEKIPDKSSPERQRMVISVDRLDYSKGILNRLRGFELFLEGNTEWHGRVCLSMIVVPSRTGVRSYQKIKRSLDELVGKINGEYGTLEWTPVIYQYKSLPQSTLIEMFRKSDVALLTPLRDGMNLVAKEYVASLTEKEGVLILSEFTGASKELSESIIINPQSIDEIASSIREALDMPLEEQRRRNEVMQSRIKRYDITRWATDFVRSLADIRKISDDAFRRKYLREDIMSRIIDEYRNSTSRIIFVNYDGTLVPYSDDQGAATPTADLTGLLQKICGKPESDIVIISGRSKDDLGKWFGDLPLKLTAENGSWIKEDHDGEWIQLKPLSGEWKMDILPILEVYTDRLPGSRILEKEYSIRWEYARADIEQSSFIARELNDHLLNITSNIDIQIFHGNRVIELSNSGINKGELVWHWINKKRYDFILAFGAGWSDELMFRSLPESAYSIKVGMSQTNAGYMIKSQSDVIKFLQRIASE